jgi:hypothetical protein
MLSTGTNQVSYGRSLTVFLALAEPLARNDIITLHDCLIKAKEERNLAAHQAWIASIGNA